MDKFEDKCTNLKGMDDLERTDNVEEMEKKCICPSCPTYNSCASSNKEYLYCFKGGSPCITDKKRCICPDCPVYESSGLRNVFYCINGSEVEIRNSH